MPYMFPVVRLRAGVFFTKKPVRDGGDHERLHFA